MSTPQEHDELEAAIRREQERQQREEEERQQARGRG